MSKEVITSAILVMVSVIGAVAFVNAILPSVYSLSESYSSVAQSMEDQFKSDIDIIFIYPDGNNIYVWVKNVGSSNIPLEKLEYSDIFIMSSSNYCNPGFESASNPKWDFTLANGGGDTWDRGETIKATITLDSLPSDLYKITFFLYNGVSTSDTFSA